jgi:hypothetical protein
MLLAMTEIENHILPAKSSNASVLNSSFNNRVKNWPSGYWHGDLGLILGISSSSSFFLLPAQIS